MERREPRRDARVRRATGNVALGVFALATSLTVLLAGVVWSGGIVTQLLGQWGQALAEGVGAVACAVAARRARGVERWVWGLFSIGQGIWAVTDFAYGFVSAVLGARVAEVSAFDIGWLAFYLPMITGVVLLYGRVRPERGWQGALDALLMVISLGLLGWMFLLEPAAAGGSGGRLGTIVALTYPALDLAGAAALGWVVVRHLRSTPPWLWWITGAFGLQVMAGISYLLGQLHGVAAATSASNATYMLAGWLWLGAATTHRRVGRDEGGPAAQTQPPTWSRAIPFVFALVMLVALVPTGRVVDVIGLVGLAVATLRVVGTLRINAVLLAERDRLLVTDPLTGARNRRSLEEELPRALARCAQATVPLSAVAFDLDHFKAVNDTHGHPAGDALLARVVERVASCLRPDDLLFRLGGDEFLVLLPGAASIHAQPIAERMREAVRTVGHEIVPDIGVSASLGIADVPAMTPDADDLVRKADDLVREADEALYAAKAAGRDAVVVFDEGRTMTPRGDVLVTR